MVGQVAAAANDAAVVRLLVEEGAKLDALAPAEEAPGSSKARAANAAAAAGPPSPTVGATALPCRARANPLETLKVLPGAGVQPNARDAAANTALPLTKHLAVAACLRTPANPRSPPPPPHPRPGPPSFAP